MKKTLFCHLSYILSPDVFHLSEEQRCSVPMSSSPVHQNWPRMSPAHPVSVKRPCLGQSPKFPCVKISLGQNFLVSKFSHVKFTSTRTGSGCHSVSVKQSCLGQSPKFSLPLIQSPHLADDPHFMCLKLIKILRRKNIYFAYVCVVCARTILNTLGISRREENKLQKLEDALVEQMLSSAKCAKL